MRQVLFAENFLFGSGISDYQHFGGTTCDLPKISAARHYEHFEHDFSILKSLGLNAFRTGIEWARIEPKEGQIDKKSVNFYHKYFSSLKQAGVTTIVTLHHFTNPKWIHKYGGWLSSRTVTKFLNYVRLVCEEFDRYVDYYVTVNEPTIYTQLAYLVGSRGLPPYHRNSQEARRCLGNLDEAIRESYDAIHDVSNGKVGVAHDYGSLPLALYVGQDVLRWLARKLHPRLKYADHVENWEGKFDFCGVNYYCRKKLRRPWPYPEGLRKICRETFRKYGKPILITENGLPNRDDNQRTGYLLSHLQSLVDAISVDRTEIIGYCWWSFLHGYEWGRGYKPFFALVDVDIGATYKRMPTRTAYVYSQIVKSRRMSLDALQKIPSPTSLKFENWI